MSALPREFVIAKRLKFQDVAWPKVLERMVGTFKIDFVEADNWLRALHTRIRRPLNLAWFSARHLSSRDNTIIACACEVHGADSIEIWFERALQIGPLSIVYYQEILFTPRIPKGSIERGGRADTKIRLGLFGRTVHIHSFTACLLTQLALCALGVLLYVLIAGLFIYGLSVFLLFLHQPAAVLRSAIHDPQIGLSLLAFLSASAAVGGRAVVNISGLVWSRIKTHLNRSIHR